MRSVVGLVSLPPVRAWSNDNIIIITPCSILSSTRRFREIRRNGLELGDQIPFLGLYHLITSRPIQSLGCASSPDHIGAPLPRFDCCESVTDRSIPTMSLQPHLPRPTARSHRCIQLV
jgi:hypothetical protein